MIFSLASEEIIAVVLLQISREGFEQPITFFSRALTDAKLKYRSMEKQAYALVKALKYFKVYIFHSKIIAYVPSNIINNILY